MYRTPYDDEEPQLSPYHPVSVTTIDIDSPDGTCNPPEKECCMLSPVEFPCVPLYTEELVSNCPRIGPLERVSSLL